jgi:hypothetical protein
LHDNNIRPGLEEYRVNWPEGGVYLIRQQLSGVFALFDRIPLMAKARTAFLGPIVDSLNLTMNQTIRRPSL